VSVSQKRSTELPRNLIPSPETHPYRSVMLIVRTVDRYAYHITGIEIAQRIFKQLVHTISKMTRGISCRCARGSRSRHSHSQLSHLGVEAPVVTGDLVLHGKVTGHCTYKKLAFYSQVVDGVGVVNCTNIRTALLKIF
jgi:hypothetical protein